MMQSDIPVCMKELLNEENYFQWHDNLLDIVGAYGDAGQEIQNKEAIDWNKLQPKRYSTVVVEVVMEDGSIASHNMGWTTQLEAEFLKEKSKLEERKERKKRDSGKLSAMLSSSLSQEIKDRLRALPEWRTAQANLDTLSMYNLIRKVALRMGVNALPLAEKKWREIRQTESLGLLLQKFDYFISIINGYHREMGIPELSNPTKVSNLLMALKPRRYDALTTPIHSGEKAMPNYEDLKSQLAKLEEAISAIEGDQIDPNVAMMTSDRKLHCYNCGKAGHSNRNCNLPQNKCSFCNIPGHKAEDCFKRKRIEKESLRQPNQSDQRTRRVEFSPLANTVQEVSKRKFPEGEGYRSSNGSKKRRRFKSKEHRANHINLQYGGKTSAFPDEDSKANIALYSKTDLDYDTDESDKAFMILQASNSIDYTQDESMLCIDTGASVHVFKSSNTLKNLSETHVISNGDTISGIDGKPLKVLEIHHSSVIGKTLIVPASDSNLLSVNQLVDKGFGFNFHKKGCEITSPSGYELTITTRRSNLYWININDLIKLLTLSSSHNQRDAKRYEVRYSSDQYTRAKDAWDLHSSLGHPGRKTLSNALLSGCIVGCTVSPQDLAIAYDLFGPCIHCLAGKTVRPSYTSSTNPAVEQVGERLHVDIFPLSTVSLGGSKYALLGLDEFSGWLVVESLISKGNLHLQQSFQGIFSKLLSHGHKIKQVISDSEENFRSCQTFLGLSGCQFNTVPPYQHAQRLERYVRTINDRMRTILDSLPYILPSELDFELLAAVVNDINELPNSLHPTSSPNIIVKGKRLNLKGKLPPPFGTPAIFHHAGKVQHKKESRSHVGIVLGRSIESENSVRAYCFATGKVVLRHTYDILPRLPEEVKWTRKARVKLADKETNREINIDLLTKRDKPTNSTTDLESQSTLQAGPVDPIPSSSLSKSAEVADLDDIVREPGMSGVTDTYMPAREGDIPRLTTVTLEAGNSSNVFENNTIHSDINIDEVELAEKPDDEDDELTSQAHVSAEPSQPISSTGTGRKRTRSTKLEGFHSYELPVGFKISIKTALAGPRAAQAREAIIDEIKNWLEYKVGHFIKEIPKKYRKNVLTSFMFLKEKYHPDGRFDKIKARLVGNGKQQDLYDFISSTTVNIAVVFMILNIATVFRAIIVVYDIKGAFLHAEIDQEEPIFIKIPSEVAKIWLDLDPTLIEYINVNGELYMELDKYIYGLKQSPLKFQLHLRSTLLALGYFQAENDDCIYIKKVQDDFSILSTHVDDILQTTTSETLKIELQHGLKDVYKSITVKDPADSYIGMTIEQSSDRTSINMNMMKTINDLISMNLDPKESSVPTPALDTLFDQDDDEAEYIDPKPYLSLVMSLMYLARLTRPDILLAVTYLATKAQKPTTSDQIKLKRVLRYLKGTKEYGIKIACNDIQLRCHCDASYGSHANGNSHTGYVISMGSSHSYVHARSAKQKVASLSSTDAEIIAVTDCLKTVVWLRNLLFELDLPLKRSSSDAIVYQDNKSAIFMITDPNSKFKRSKHILTKIAFARQLHREGIVKIVYCGTKSMIADVLTKPLQGAIFLALIAALLGIMIGN